MKRWLWWCALPIALVVVLGFGWRWYLQRPFEVMLPVVNHSDQSVEVLIYGEGLSDHAFITDLQPHDSRVVRLTLNGVGPVRIRVESASARIDSQLIGSNALLRRAPQRFEIQPGNQFVLVPL